MTEDHQAVKMEALGRFARAVAHEFNNVLAAINLNARMSPPDLEGVLAAVDRGMALSRRLSFLGRAGPTTPKPVNVALLVAGLEGEIRALAGPGVSVSVQVDPSATAIRSDPALLGRLALELARNAVEAASPGGSVAVTVSPAPAGCRLAVEDSGPGMDGVTRERAFEPYFSTRERGAGTGLGLAEAWSIVRQSGGRISLTSAPGKGTRVEVFLPAPAV